jgi:hypothetical protein
MKCPVCSYPMTQLFISSVCDKCNPPTAAAEFDTVQTEVKAREVWGWCRQRPIFNKHDSDPEFGWVYDLPAPSNLISIKLLAVGELVWKRGHDARFALVHIFSSKEHALADYRRDPDAGPVAWPEEQPMSITQVGPPPMPFSSNGRLIP